MVPKAGLGLGCRDLPAGLGGSHLVDPVDHLRCRGAGNRPGTGREPAGNLARSWGWRGRTHKLSLVGGLEPWNLYEFI